MTTDWPFSGNQIWGTFWFLERFSRVLIFSPWCTTYKSAGTCTYTKFLNWFHSWSNTVQRYLACFFAALTFRGSTRQTKKVKLDTDITWTSRPVGSQLLQYYTLSGCSAHKTLQTHSTKHTQLPSNINYAAHTTPHCTLHTYNAQSIRTSVVISNNGYGEWPLYQQILN